MRRTDEILDKPYRDNGAYRVPEGYFSTLNKRITDALPEDKPKRKGALIAFLPRMKYAAAARRRQSLWVQAHGLSTCMTAGKPQEWPPRTRNKRR